jgi:hypothetical protein
VGTESYGLELFGTLLQGRILSDFNLLAEYVANEM